MKTSENLHFSYREAARKTAPPLAGYALLIKIKGENQ